MNGDDVAVQEPLQGIQGNVDLPEPQPEQRRGRGEGPTADINLEYYGRNFGEMNHAANNGPDGSPLEDYHVAISPNVANDLGLKLHDWVWVGPQLRQYGDVSAIANKQGGFDRYTHNTVEVRDYAADGKTTLRKATPKEVEEYAPRGGGGMDLSSRPSAQMASMMTGKAPSQITAEDVNNFIQPQIEGMSRGLLAGDMTAAALQGAQDQGDQPSFMQPAEEPGAMDVASSGMGGGMDLMGTGAGGGDIISTDSGGLVPNPAHAQLTNVNKATGARDFNGGAQVEGGLTYHPNTDTLEWTIGGRRFIKTGEYGKVISAPSAKIVRNPDTGEYYNMATGVPVKVQLPGQSPAYNENLTPEANLNQLSPQDRMTVQMFSTYQLPLTTRYGRMNPEFARLRPYIQAANPHIDPRTYQIQQQTMMQMASGQNGSVGQRLNSWNQSLIHAGALWRLSQALPEGPLPKANSVWNWLKTNTGSEQQTNWETGAQLFATEVSRAFQGGVPAQSEIQHIMDQLKASGSKAQLQGNIKDVMAKFIEGGLESINYGYQRNMGSRYENLISPQAAASLSEFGYKKFADRDLAPIMGKAAPNPAEQRAVDTINAHNQKYPKDQIEMTPENIKKLMQQRQ